MPFPRSISCEVCGKQFFKRSYAIHLQQCKKNRATAYTKCKKCNLPVSNDEYSEHFLSCKQKKKASQKHKNKESKTDTADLCDFSDRARDETGRVQCQVCKRRFAEDRIAKHERICLEISGKKRKKYASASRCRLKGTVFEHYRSRNKKQSVNSKRNWREEHEETQKGVEQGLLIAEFKRHNLPMSELPGMNERLEDLELSLLKPKVQAIIEKILKFKLKCDYFETKEATRFKIGDRIILKKRKLQAKVKYIGRVPELFNGYWLGVELLEGKGCNDGLVKNKVYFECSNGMGLFIRPSKVLKLSTVIHWSSKEEGKTKTENDVAVKKPPLSARFRSQFKKQTTLDSYSENDLKHANTCDYLKNK